MPQVVCVQLCFHHEHCLAIRQRQCNLCSLQQVTERFCAQLGEKEHAGEVVDGIQGFGEACGRFSRPIIQQTVTQ